MLKALLIRGMLAGVVAGVVAFGFAQFFGEPEIEHAIRLEEQASAAAHAQQHAGAAAHEHEEELVSRGMQSGIGLLTALALYGAGIGGLFSIAFALAYGRLGSLGPRATSALLAAAGFVAVAAIPFLKYPAIPPGIGSEATLGSRTSLFLVMIAISIVAAVIAVSLARHYAARAGFWMAGLIACASFLVIVTAAVFLMPEVREIPAEFPADVLWRFRVSSLAMQLLIWATLGLAFGALVTRLVGQASAR